MKGRFWLLLVCIFATTVDIYWIFENPYDHYKMRDCVLMHKVFIPNNTSQTFLFVLRNEDGRLFSTFVTAETYTTTNEGEHVRFDLRESDIQQTGWQNFLMIIRLLMAIAGIALILIIIISFSYKKG